MTGRRQARRIAAAAGLYTVVLFPTVGCQRPEPPVAEVAAVPCQMVEGTLPPGASTQPLAGAYSLTLIATSGPRSGDSTTGELRLTPYPGGDRSGTIPSTAGTTRYPLHGSANLELERVGAAAPGQISSTNPSRPGALVIDWIGAGSPAPRTVAIRLGSEANRSDVTPFDPAYTTLTVTSIAPLRFAGRWESGLQGQRVAGYFCADRV